MFRINFEVPDGWTYKEQVTVAQANDADGVSANVIASSEPIDPEKSARDYADEMGERYEKEFPGYEELALEEIDIFGGTHGWLRRFAWEPEQGVRIDQLQAYYAADGRCYTAVASAGAGEFDEHKQRLVKVLNSFSVSRP
jgi:hypothetical protein